MGKKLVVGLAFVGGCAAIGGFLAEDPSTAPRPIRSYAKDAHSPSEPFAAAASPVEDLSVSHADEDRWQRCAGLAQTIMEKTKASYDRTSAQDHNVFMKHAAVPDLQVTCSPYQNVGTFGGWSHGGYPPESYYKILAMATAIVTDDDFETVRKALKTCQKNAIKSASEETSEVDTAKTHIECQAFTRDGGAVSISAWAK